MADKKITDLPAAAAAALTQLIEVVTNPSTTPVSQKETLQQIKDLFDTFYFRLSQLPVLVSQGGTGLTSLTANRIPYGFSGSALSSSGNLTFDSFTNTLMVGTTEQVCALTGSGGAGFSAVPSLNVFGIGSVVHASGWTGNGFVFTNYDTGTTAFSLVCNNDTAYFGFIVDASTAANGFQINPTYMTIFPMLDQPNAITANTPGNTTTPAAWEEMRVNGVQYFRPLYQ